MERRNARRLFNNLVGAREQGCGYLQAEGFGRSQIDDQLELRRAIFLALTSQLRFAPDP